MNTTRGTCVIHEEIKQEYAYSESEGRLAEAVKSELQGPFDFVISTAPEAKLFFSMTGKEMQYIGEKVMEGYTVEVFRGLNIPGAEKALRILEYHGTLEELATNSSKPEIDYVKARGKILEEITHALPILKHEYCKDKLPYGNEEKIHNLGLKQPFSLHS
jgi:hypothetical protein